MRRSPGSFGTPGGRLVVLLAAILVGGGLPGAELTTPAWASGSPTLATSGATFLVGDAWGSWAGSLVVTTLKEEDLRRFSVAPDGRVTAVETLVDGEFGALYLSTANGSGDRVLRVTLRSAPPDE